MVPSVRSRLELMELMAQDQHLNAGIIVFLRFVIINQLEDEAIDMMEEMIADQEARLHDDNFYNDDDYDDYDDDDDNDDNDDDDVQQVEDAAEPQVDIQVNQPVEAEDLLPGRSRRRAREEDDEGDEMSRKRFRCSLDCVSSSDTDSDAEEEDPASEPSSSQEPGASRKRSREDDDEEDGRSSKQFRQ